MNRFPIGAAVAAACLFTSEAALAHATLAIPEGRPNASYRGVVQIGHGCDGSPTTAIRVTVPDGVIAVHPMPKPGWTLATTKGPYAKPYPYFGQTLTEGVKEIVWSGSSLPDEFYDEFTFMARITDDHQPGTVVRFPIVQECRAGARNWVQMPAPGQDPHELKEPAPGVRIVAGTAAAAAASGNPPGVVRAGAIVIEAPWTRATPAGAKVAGGYLRITNTGQEPDRLVGVSSPNASRGEVHEMSMSDGVAKMAPLEAGLPIPPGGTVELKPGGQHLMFMDLRTGLKEKDTLRATLTFEKAGPVEVSFPAGGLGAQSAPADAHAHH